VAALTAIALGLTVGGTIWNAVQTHRAGKKQDEQAQFNAAIAEEQATDAIARGKEEEDRYRAQVRSRIGTTRAAFASQGVDVGSGSAVDVQADQAYLGELDALQIRNNAAREAWGYRVEATNYRDAGRNARSAAKSQIIGSILGTGTSLLEAQTFGRSGSRRSSGGGVLPSSRVSGAGSTFNTAPRV